MLHELKTDPNQFDFLFDDSKKFEFRKADRNFRPGDILILREYDPLTQYTGQYLLRSVTHILREGYGLPDGYCIMSIMPLTPAEEAYHAAGVKAA
jgi:ethanolamine utilization microcompartment shell protein EutS